MAQAPATSKWHRALIRLQAACGLPTRPAAPSEAAALALRALPRTGATHEMVVFLIPLVGPEHVGDWTTVTDRLQATLQSFLDQDNPNWRAVICCQQKPPLPADPRISHLPYDDPAPGNDKWRKLDRLCAHLPDLGLPNAYVMSFDADDLLRQGTVQEMLSRQRPGGYLVQSGFVMDHATGDIALADKPGLAHPLRKPFWKLCGSCAALSWSPDQPETTRFLQLMTAHEHRMFPHLAALAGRELVPLSRPSVLYILNHGENFGARRGRVGFKTRFVQRFKVTDKAILKTVADDFPDV